MDGLTECQYAALLSAASNYSVDTSNIDPAWFIGLKADDLFDKPPILH